MLKGTESGLLIQIRDIEKDLKELELKLRSKMFITRIDFFIYPKDKVHFDQLEALLKKHGFKLFIAEEKSNRTSVKLQDKKTETVKETKTAAEKARASAQESGADVPDLMDFFSNLDTLICKRTLRSGQRVEHKGNVVVIGDVNAGAEVRADGDIFVFGKVKGIIHAGKSGDKSATIIATTLKSPQIRIATVYSQTAVESNKIVGYEKVYLDSNDKMVIEEIEK